MSAPVAAALERTLREELRAVEAQYPGWHVFLSSEGRVWAVSAHNIYGGSGTTVDAGTPEGIAREIAAVVHAWERAA